VSPEEQPDPDEIFRELLNRARDVDEFEYCCALLRIRGMEDPGWDPTTESFTLVQQVVGLLHAPLDKGLSYRLTLFLYSHVTEMADFYNVPANMLRICAGERYVINPFSTLPKTPKPAAGDPLDERVAQLVALANTAGFARVGNLYSRLFIRQVRNAFYHSDYALAAESFNMRHGEPLNLDGMLQKAVPYSWLFPCLELGINCALALLSLLLESARAYTANKVVRGRFTPDDSYTDIELLTDSPYGLHGFRSPPTPTRPAAAKPEPSA